MRKAVTLSNGAQIQIHYFTPANGMAYKQPELLDTPLRYGSTVASQIAVARAMVKHTDATPEDAAVAVGRLAGRQEGLGPKAQSARIRAILDALQNNE